MRTTPTLSAGCTRITELAMRSSAVSIMISPAFIEGCWIPPSRGFLVAQNLHRLLQRNLIARACTRNRRVIPAVEATLVR